MRSLLEYVRASEGFLRLSDALHRIKQGMWAGLPRPEPLRAIKPRDLRGGSVIFTLTKEDAAKSRSDLPDNSAGAVEPDLLVKETEEVTFSPAHDKPVFLGFGPWKEEAGKLLKKALIEGKLPVYVQAASPGARERYGSTPVRVPAAVVGRMILSRATLPDVAIRPSLKIAGGDQNILALLRDGLLLVPIAEFNEWYRLQRNKGTWPSQRSRNKKHKEGRPSKRTDELRDVVISEMRERKSSVAELHRRVTCAHRFDVSADTLARLLDELCRESGDPVFRRRKHTPRKGARY